jgi:hypothetical protein
MPRRLGQSHRHRRGWNIDAEIVGGNAQRIETGRTASQFGAKITLQVEPLF